VTDQEYSQLQEFVQKHTYENQTIVDYPTFLLFLNQFARTDIITCENCLFHHDCQIEKTLILGEKPMFCSFARRKFSL
jgi:hypothetical protein